MIAKSTTSGSDRAASTHVVIAIDAMGGDSGPSPVVSGMSKAAEKNPNISFILFGDKAMLDPLVAKRKALEGRCEVRNADKVVTMDTKPSQAMRNGKGTSMWAAITAVRDKEAAVCVSCGNTGALMAMSMVRLRKIPGINRPAIACLWPSRNPTGFNVMLDAGADIRAEAEDLLQYALMGTSYARVGLELERPRVGLLNVGTEEHKGRAQLREAYDLIGKASETAPFEFVGYVEGGDLPTAKVDVIVTDGFTGNVALKTGEGTAKLISELLKGTFKYSFWSRITALLAMPSLRRLGKAIDPRRVNGGVFLGLNGSVVKSHGSADSTGVSAAIKLAFQLGAADIPDRIAARVASMAKPVQGTEQQGQVFGNKE